MGGGRCTEECSCCGYMSSQASSLSPLTLRYNRYQLVHHGGSVLQSEDIQYTDDDQKDGSWRARGFSSAFCIPEPLILITERAINVDDFVR